MLAYLPIDVAMIREDIGNVPYEVVRPA